jgi:hypothetical protein
MAQNAIPNNILDDYIAKLLVQIEKEYHTESEIKTANFDRVVSLLTEMKKPAWALRPRTYVVLRMMDRLNVMDSFIEQDLFDISFPYTERRLPSALSEMSDRLRFIEVQNCVLTTAKDIENIENQRHVHFGMSPRSNAFMAVPLMVPLPRKLCG